MLTTPNHLHVFQMFGNGFQEDLIHHLPSDRDKSDWHVISQILLLVLLEDWSDICLFTPQKPHLTAMTFQKSGLTMICLYEANCFIYLGRLLYGEFQDL